MKTLETRIVMWIDSLIYPPQPKPQPKDNILTDYLLMRYHRILKLRELARKEASERCKNGEPYSNIKIVQAELLLREITNRLNSRPYSTIYSMN